MKKLVLGSLLLAALVSQTTGCIITTDDDGEFARMDAEWSFHDVNVDGDPVTTNPCPLGFDTVALHNQQFDPTDDRDIGPEVVDLFDCDVGRDFTDALNPGVYETFLSVTSSSGASVYASSISAIVDVTDTDKTFETQFIDNGGYFRIDWDLRKGTTPLNCRDIAGIAGVEIIATLSGSTAAISDKFDCEDGFGYSAAVREGRYVIKVDAINGANQAIGSGPTLNDKVMGIENDIVDLGVAVLQFP